MKDGLGPKAIRRIALSLRKAEPTFPAEAFIRSATAGLARLELKERVSHVVEALHAHLPQPYLEALAILRRAARHWDRGDQNDPLRGFAAWPVIDFVGVYGLEHFDASLVALRELTPLFTAEFAIRPFIEKSPRAALKVLRSWTRDPDEHVRRLVSEGTRPRLPWGGHLRCFQNDPKPVIRLLDRLKDDPSEMVRRSAANNLNDISKDHPALVLETCRRWSKRASAERRWIVERALRTLVKAGHPKAFQVLGRSPKPRVQVRALRLAPAKLKLGQTLQLSFNLVSTGRRPQQLVVDYAVHHVKQNGERTRKVFKLKQVELPAGEHLHVEKRHSLRRITTRRYHAGVHLVEVLVNGVALGRAKFDLQV